MSDQPAAPESVLVQIQKLSQLASRNPNEHEAASAMAKAQELLERYNLTLSEVQEAQVGSGARQKAALEGGFHQYERDLWRDVAHLNFCVYWHERYWNSKGERNKYGEVRQWMYRHRVVGRRVNVAATQAMAGYLMEVATRLTREHTQGLNTKYSLSNWANSYRRGIVARICRKLRERRNEALRAEEERRAQEARAADGSVSTSTALSLAVYVDREYDANLDFIYGEGTAARWAAERARQAAIKRMSEEEYTRWAAANPEEARKHQAEMRRQTRQANSKADTSNIDRSAFWSGYDAGAEVSIDQQVDVGRPAGRIGHG